MNRDVRIGESEIMRHRRVGDRVAVGDLVSGGVAARTIDIGVRAFRHGKRHIGLADLDTVEEIARSAGGSDG